MKKKVKLKEYIDTQIKNKLNESSEKEQFLIVINKQIKDLSKRAVVLSSMLREYKDVPDDIAKVLRKITNSLDEADQDISTNLHTLKLIMDKNKV